MLPIRDHLPTRTPAVVNYAIIGANLIVFALETALGGDGSVERWTLVPAQLLAHPAAAAPTLLTHMFLHGSVMHVGGNMLFLWIFGDNVEDALGHARYALFYFACGLAAAFAQVAMAPHSAIGMLGASGAIAGVLAAYGLLYPRSPITVVNPIPIMWIFWGLFISFPAWLVILEFFAVNLWNALQPSSGGGVAFMAHVGGFLAGLVLLPLLRTRGPVEHGRWERWLTPRRAS
jgi:membrane associated rhomboid family serine protease